MNEGQNLGRLLTFQDSLEQTFKDQMSFHNNKYPSIGGLVVVKNADGEVLLRKNNLVVFRGRLFALERIFGQPFNVPYAINRTGDANTGNSKGSNPLDIQDIVQSGLSSGDTIENNLDYLLNRRVCLFGIGSGGVANEAWFSPSTVVPTSTNLISPIAFCDGESDDYTNNPDFYHGERDGKYYLKRLNTKDSNDGYCPSWVYDKATNTIAMMCSIHINESYLSNPSDGQIQRINELALYMANETVTQDNGVNVSSFSNIEMFSRITFDTESLQSNKELLIEYYIFA